MLELQKAINKAKAKLIQKAKSKGIYENFGQKESRDIIIKFEPLLTTDGPYRREAQILAHAFDARCQIFDYSVLDKYK